MSKRLLATWAVPVTNLAQLPKRGAGSSYQFVGNASHRQRGGNQGCRRDEIARLTNLPITYTMQYISCLVNLNTF